MSFLGLGIQPPQPSLGRMIFDSQGFVTLAWWMAVFPGAAIFVIVLAFNLLGDGLRDVLDPKQRTMLEARRQAMTDPVLDVADLHVRIGKRAHRPRCFADGRSASQTLGIVGESGSGKSMTVLAATGLLDAPGAVVTGSSVLAGEQDPVELIGASARVLRSVHGGRIGFVFQDPGTSLNPLLTLERQITESLEAHRRQTRREARARALELLEAVGLPDPETRLGSYPHQLSGGQRQRVMIAIALACDPELLIADEPTTSLDVTTQAQIIDLVRDLQRDFGTAVVWISHDLGVIGQVADDVTVLRDGEAVEQAPILDVFDRPQQRYTRELLEARPLVGGERPGSGAGRCRRTARRPGPRRPVPGHHTRRPHDHPRGEGSVLPDPARHHAGTGRRVRLGQVDGRGRTHRPGETGRRPRTPRRRRRPRGCGGADREGAAATDQPGLPGPVLVAGSPRCRSGRRSASR